MKKYILLVCLTISSIATGEIINFPDSNFKNKLLAANPLLNTTAGIGPLNNLDIVRIDTNNNGEIEVSEAQVITYLLIPGSNISDITGIEYFTNLSFFFCFQNNLTSLDAVSQLTQLERIFCDQNQLTFINLSSLTNLRIFSCRNNFISTLDFSNNPQLTIVYCGNNQLSSLDFSYNPLFNDLGCRNNPSLTTLKIKNGTMQLFGSSTIYNECWTGTSLNNICADASEIPALQAYLTGCGINTSGININSSCVLSNEEFENYSFTLYPNPVKDLLMIDITNSKENFTMISIYNLLGEKMISHPLVERSRTSIDVSQLATGIYIAQLENEYQTVQIKIIKN